MPDDPFRNAGLSHAGSGNPETLIRVGNGAFLEYVPDHIIPYRNSQFRQLLRVEMGRGSRAILWDALASGRVAGERAGFDEVDSRVEISLCRKTVFLNRTRIRPATRSRAIRLRRRIQLSGDVCPRSG